MFAEEMAQKADMSPVGALAYKGARTLQVTLLDGMVDAGPRRFASGARYRLTLNRISNAPVASGPDELPAG